MDHHHVVGHDLSRLVLAGHFILHQHFAEHLHLGALHADEVEIPHGDLSLGGLGFGFHEMLRRQAPQILLGRLVVAQRQQLTGVNIRHC